MDNISWLTIVLGLIEIACGTLILIRGRASKIGAIGMMAFLVFITIVGYGWSTTGLGEDLLKTDSPPSSWACCSYRSSRATKHAKTAQLSTGELH